MAINGFICHIMHILMNVFFCWSLQCICLIPFNHTSCCVGKPILQMLQCPLLSSLCWAYALLVMLSQTRFSMLQSLMALIIFGQKLWLICIFTSLGPLPSTLASPLSSHKDRAASWLIHMATLWKQRTLDMSSWPYSRIKECQSDVEKSATLSPSKMISSSPAIKLQEDVSKKQSANLKSVSQAPTDNASGADDIK